MPHLPGSATLIPAYFVTLVMTMAMRRRPRDVHGCCALRQDFIASSFCQCRMLLGRCFSAVRPVPLFLTRGREGSPSGVFAVPACRYHGRSETAPAKTST